MEWSELYNQDNKPSLEDVSNFVRTNAWQNINTYLQNAYKTKPSISYSGCSMQKGWNLKYKSKGKSLCVLYPMDKSFKVLVMLGEKAIFDVEMSLPSYSEYVQGVFNKSKYSMGGKWLMLSAEDDSVLEDIKRLIAVKVKPHSAEIK